MRFTYTPEQSAAIAARYNELAKPPYHLSHYDCYLIFGDNFDEDLELHGETQIEIAGIQSITGNPQTFYISASDMTVEDRV